MFKKVTTVRTVLTVMMAVTAIMIMVKAWRAVVKTWAQRLELKMLRKAYMQAKEEGSSEKQRESQRQR